jgi:hypothetical protein
VQNYIRAHRNLYPKIAELLDKGAEYKDRALSAELLLRWSAMPWDAQWREWCAWLGDPRGRKVKKKRIRVTIDRVRTLERELAAAGEDTRALRYLLGETSHPLKNTE